MGKPRGQPKKSTVLTEADREIWETMKVDLSRKPDKEDACSHCQKVALVKDSIFAGYLCRACWLDLGLRPE